VATSAVAIDPNTGERIPDVSLGSSQGAPQIDPATGERVTPAPPTNDPLAKLLGQQKQTDLERWLQPTPHDPSQGVLGNVGTALSNVGGAGLNALTHPEQLLTGAVMGSPPVQAYQDVKNAVSHLRGQPNPTDDAAQHPVQTALQAGEGLIGQAGALGGPEAFEGSFSAAVPSAKAAMGAYDALRGASNDADAALLKAMNLPAKSKFAQRYLDAGDAARPYLQGVQSLDELQPKLAAAKAEVWGPYQQAVQTMANNGVMGPDGPTTVAELEKARLELSALNRGLKTGDPMSLQLAQQKGLSQAELLAKEKAVQAALDPQLAQTGIDPQAIRKTFGQLSTVQSRFAGRSTIAEPDQPYGLGRIVNVNVTKPGTAVEQGIQAVRDIAAGKPLISGKATDENIATAFKSGGDKPDLGTFNPQASLGPSRQLPSQAGAPYAMPAPQMSGGPPMPPAVDATTRAQRLGLLLPQESGGRIPLPYNPQMSGGERIAALMQMLRKQPQAALPARGLPIQLPPPQ
jgi:hypothetical protein